MKKYLIILLVGLINTASAEKEALPAHQATLQKMKELPTTVHCDCLRKLPHGRTESCCPGQERGGNGSPPPKGIKRGVDKDPAKEFSGRTGKMDELMQVKVAPKIEEPIPYKTEKFEDFAKK